MNIKNHTRFYLNCYDERMKSKPSEEFENFDRTMRALVSVSHDEIKAKLDAEKAAKNKKRKAKASALDRASRARD